MIFETHAHYDGKEFDEDRASLLDAIYQSGIHHLVNIGADLASSQRSLALAGDYPWIYASVGIHPESIAEFYSSEEQDGENFPWEDRSYAKSVLEQIRELSHHPKAVAIGEIGLDYYWMKEERQQEAQRYFFQRQLQLALEEDLPVVIHSRDAAADTMEIMREAAKEGCRGVIHCYSYSKEQAREYVKLGYYIGVGGVVTFKNGRKLQAVVEDIPLGAIVLETDSPYMSPEPHRGKRNDSRNLIYVAEKIAQIKGISCEEVFKVTEENALRLYSEVSYGDAR